VQSGQEALLQLQRHVGQLGLGELERRERPVEHLTVDRVRDRRFEAVPRRTEGPEDDPEPGLVQAGKRPAQARHLGQHRVRRESNALQDQLARHRRSQ
jgi:hypothetical protein